MGILLSLETQAIAAGDTAGHHLDVWDEKS